jgi:hypothetical protein
MAARIPAPRGFAAAARVCEIIGDRGCAADWKRRARSLRARRTSISSNFGSWFRTHPVVFVEPVREWVS